MHEQSDHGTEAHGQVIGQPVIADSFATPRRRQDVNQNGIAGHRHHPESQTVYDTEGDEKRQTGSQDIAAEDRYKDEISQQIPRTAEEPTT